MTKRDNNEKIKVRFVVDKILFRDKENLFTIMKTTFKKYDSTFVPTSETIIKGHFTSLFVDDEYQGEGHWIKDSTYGWQFVLEHSERVLPSTQKGLRDFLRKFVKGIGSKTANAIVDYYKEATLSEIEKGWEKIAEVPGVGEKRAKRIHEEYMKHKAFEKIAVFVLQVGGGYKTVLKIYEAFGDQAIRKIRENPYILCQIDNLGFQTADKFAKNLGFPYNSKERIEQAILYYIQRQMSEKGHLYVKDDALLKDINTFLDKNSVYVGENITIEEIHEGLFKLVEGKKITIETENGENFIYLSFYNFVENKIVEFLKKLVTTPKNPIATHGQIQNFINKYEETGFKFAERQKEAIFMAIQNGVSILTGGPGTGKTQTINSIIQCVKSIKSDAIIELSAPTGKASKRMTELTGMDAKTIHRLIGLNGAEEETESNEIFADLLIIDESSMIDAYVFYKMLSAIQNDTRVLLVGDYEQLPSVGAGLILRDLIESEKIPTTTLNEIFRQAKESQIVMNAHAIVSSDHKSITFDHSKNDCFWMEHKDKMTVQKKILLSVERLLVTKRFTMDEIQVLVPIRKGELGVDDLNRLIQNKFNPREHKKPEVKITETSYFRLGDKVMQTVNNYELGVFNGEVGKIVEIGENEDGETLVTVDFEDKEVEYNQIALEELTLAYCITIHKSQGSEFKCVIMPIHSSQEFMLNKNLVYTGLTRAREMVAMIGERNVLNQSVYKTDNTVRNSRIKPKLIKSL